MELTIIGASKGLGRAFIEGLGNAGDTLTGVSRTRPADICPAPQTKLNWIEADMTAPVTAAQLIAAQTPAQIDTVIYNLGIWETEAFDENYAFLDDTDAQIANIINVNITGAILVLRHLLPKLLRSPRPRVILTGSTSGLRQSGRPEVAFGASKFALTGIADALREGFRGSSLGITCLQLGYLNTDDSLATPRAEAAARGQGTLIPVHDVVTMTRAILSLSDASFVREIVLPAIADERF